MMIQTRDVKSASLKLWHLMAISSFFLWGLVVADDKIAAVVSGRDAPHTLVVRELYYRDGLFYQRVEPSGVGKIRGYWTTEIEIDGRQICSGGGVAPYSVSTVPKSMTADQWTGGDCSAMRAGLTYTAMAIWEVRDQSGYTQRTTKSFDFTARGEPQ